MVSPGTPHAIILSETNCEDILTTAAQDMKTYGNCLRTLQTLTLQLRCEDFSRCCLWEMG